MEYKTALVIILLFIVLYFHGKGKHKKKLNNVFEGRESLTNNEFYNLYFKSTDTPEYIMNGVKNILEEQLDENLAKLSAEDDIFKKY